VEHPNQLGAFFIDGGGVEIINRFLTFRLHWMGGGTGIFT
jgi:hypothetical protein